MRAASSSGWWSRSPSGATSPAPSSSTRRCTAAFDEDQIFRIDHYLGKETVQNVLALRFANAIFEPIWNRRYVEQVQITVAESIGVEHRGGFYETAGALRDIVQNHVMQVLALTMMEPPTRMDAEHIRDEKVKLLKAIDIPSPDEAVDKSVRGQYQGGRGRPASRSSATARRTASHPTARSRPTWPSGCTSTTGGGPGVPVYVRTGKRLPARVTEVALQFHEVPFLAFEEALSRDLRPNVLVLRIQPHEGISLHFGAKVPGEAFRVQSVSMDFGYEQAIARHGHGRLHPAVVRCDVRRPDPVHPDRRGRAGLADRRPLPRRRGPSRAAGCTSTTPGPGVPTSPTSSSSAPATHGGNPDL